MIKRLILLHTLYSFVSLKKLLSISFSSSKDLFYFIKNIVPGFLMELFVEVVVKVEVA